MTVGIGVDIAAVRRFKKWVRDASIIERFFNENERFSGSKEEAACRHYASRFAVKEAFSKALGTGLVGFDLKEVYVGHSKSGQPVLKVQGAAEALVKSHFGECKLLLSISHEQEYAVAFVIIEKEGA